MIRHSSNTSMNNLVYRARSRSSCTERAVRAHDHGDRPVKPPERIRNVLSSTTTLFWNNADAQSYKLTHR